MVRTFLPNRARLLILGLFAGTGFSFGSSLNTVSIPRFACLSIDGIPIAIGTPLAEKCCFAEGLRVSAGEECRIGFFGGALGAARNGLTRIEEASGAEAKRSNGEPPIDEDLSTDSEEEAIYDEPALPHLPVAMPSSVPSFGPSFGPDSREYFLRIDRKSSLFEVVSKRYQKEIEIQSP